MHIKAKNYAVHLSDEPMRYPFPMNCLLSTHTDSGLMVGDPEVTTEVALGPINVRYRPSVLVASFPISRIISNL